MAETARFFDLASYTEANFAEVQSRLARDGVLAGLLNELVPSMGASSVTIGTGEAFVQGFWYRNDAARELAIAPNAGGTARVDLVVLALNRAANTLLLGVKQGTVGGGTPTLTQVAGGNWEHLIATVTTVSGVSTLVDNRSWRLTVVNGRELSASEQPTVGPTALRKTLVYDPATKAIDIVPATPQPNGFINGLLRVNQRNRTSLTTTGTICDGWYYTTNVSGYSCNWNNTVGVTAAQAGMQLGNCVAIGKSDSSVISSGGYAMLGHGMEGLDWAKLHGSPLVISWWSYATKVGNYVAAVLSNAADRSFVHLYNIPVANVWTHQWFRVTSPYTAGGSWGFDQGRGSIFLFPQSVGTALCTATATDTWLTGTQYAPTGYVSPMTASGDQLYWAGLKIEPGYYPTPLTVPDGDAELARCQRRLERLNNAGGAPLWGIGKTINTTQLDAYWSFKVEKRVLPTAYAGSGTFVYDTGAGLGSATFNSVVRGGTWGALVRLTGSWTAGVTFPVGFDSAGTNWLEAAAEL